MVAADNNVASDLRTYLPFLVAADVRFHAKQRRCQRGTTSLNMLICSANIFAQDMPPITVDGITLSPLDFSALIKQKREDCFHGSRSHECGKLEPECAGTREWCVREVTLWLQLPDDRMFWLLGDGGTGKTVITVKVVNLMQLPFAHAPPSR